MHLIAGQNTDMKLDISLETIIRYLARERGIDCFHYKPDFVERRLASRMRLHKAPDYAAYLQILQHSPEELDALLQALMINLSYFFRDKSMYDVLRTEVLPNLLSNRERNGERRLRLWSAGCGTGEEPYSLAILLHQVLKGHISCWDISILATDADEIALERARAGVYRAASFREISPEALSPYILPQRDLFRVAPAVKALVKFQRRDLLADSYPTGMDLIACRNVLIYFARPEHDRILAGLHRALREDGILISGKTEIMLGATARLFHAVDAREHIYAKRAS